MRHLRLFEEFSSQGDLGTAVQVVISQFGEAEQMDKVQISEWGDDTMEVPSDLVVLRLLETSSYRQVDLESFEIMLEQECPGVFYEIDMAKQKLVLGPGTLEGYCKSKLAEMFPWSGGVNKERTIWTYVPPGERFEKGLVLDNGGTVLVNKKVWEFLSSVMCMGWRSGDAQRLVASWLEEHLGLEKDSNTTYTTW